jgi:hypothetical protein|tara:strand:+ start:4413 stop:4613 length:201 start_codon:yes stop_codon:yes gene_type:complete
MKRPVTLGVGGQHEVGIDLDLDQLQHLCQIVRLDRLVYRSPRIYRFVNARSDQKQRDDCTDVAPDI